MRKQMIINGGLLLLLLLAFTLPAAAQQPSAQVTHYYKNGLAFDYPASMQIEDLSKEDGQQLVLTTGKQGAQIMVISRFDKINSAQELAAARKEHADGFAETMYGELLKLDPKTTRASAQVEIAGTQAPGTRLRATLDNQPGSAEVYSVLLGKRLVLVTIIGPDKEIAAAANAWATIRSSLKVE
jgi:hypothetical protein